MNQREAPVELAVGEGLEGLEAPDGPTVLTHVAVWLAAVIFLVALALLAWSASIG